MKVDVTGRKFGSLIVIERYGLDRSGKNSTWICRCECGKILIKSKPNLSRKGDHSCGCKMSQIMKTVFFKHGMIRTQAYYAWSQMKTRCLNKNCNRYKDYAGRGITICERWINSFENFLEDMGHTEKGMSLERIDNNLGYSKENCKWIPKNYQQKNRRVNIYVDFEGEKITVRDLWIRTGKKYSYLTYLNYAKRGKECALYR